MEDNTGVTTLHFRRIAPLLRRSEISLVQDPMTDIALKLLTGECEWLVYLRQASGVLGIK
jgi:hypothetical protein